MHEVHISGLNGKNQIWKKVPFFNIFIFLNTNPHVYTNCSNPNRDQCPTATTSAAAVSIQKNHLSKNIISADDSQKGKFMNQSL